MPNLGQLEDLRNALPLRRAEPIHVSIAQILTWWVRTPRIIVVGDMKDAPAAMTLSRHLVTRIDLDAESDEGVRRLVEALRVVVPHEERESSSWLA